MTTAIIAEDEPHIRKQLRTLLAELWPELTVVAEAPDGVAALSVLREHAPDIAFLDVKMPGLTGVDVLQAIGATRTLVVFVTAFDTFAVSAYAEGVVDYMVKPISASRLAKTITRLQARLAEAGTTSGGAQTQPLSTTGSNANSAPNAPLRWVQASQGEKVVFLTTDEILFFQSDTKYTRVVTEKREAFIRKPIKALLDALDVRQFLQVHRGTLVNVNYIDVVERHGLRGMRLRLRGSAEVLDVAQTYQSQFRGM